MQKTVREGDVDRCGHLKLQSSPPGALFQLGHILFHKETVIRSFQIVHELSIQVYETMGSILM